MQIYTLGKFLGGKGEEDLKTGIVKIDGKKIFDGQIVGIGGEYNSRYAIIAWFCIILGNYDYIGFIFCLKTQLRW